MEVYKICTKCKIEKSLTEFHKDKHSKSGYRVSCKTCCNIIAMEFRRKYSQIVNRENKDKKVCGYCKKERKVLEFTKNRCCKDGLASECKACKYKCNEAYSKARKLYDPEFKLLKNMRIRLNNVLRGKSKSRATRQLIGIDFKTFSKWIEFQLEEGMTLQNYGSVWHLDHVIPISSFNLLDEEELFKAMNWMNIRPLLALKNLQKANKIDHRLYIMQQVKAHYFLKNLDKI